MPTFNYRTKDGKRVPGTTTVIGHRKESGGLIHWASAVTKTWVEENLPKLQGEALTNETVLGFLGEMEKNDYRKARDKAADAGNLAHEMIENSLQGEDPSDVEGPDELFETAWKGYKAYEEWAQGSKLEIVETETPLVSEQFRFGGTPDAIGMVAGQLALLDWKTSNRIYGDYLMQLAAYRHLWEVNHEGKKLHSFHLLRFGKEFGDFHHHSWPVQVMDIAWEAFRNCRRLYDLDKDLKRAVG